MAMWLSVVNVVPPMVEVCFCPSWEGSGFKSAFLPSRAESYAWVRASLPSYPPQSLGVKGTFTDSLDSIIVVDPVSDTASGTQNKIHVSPRPPWLVQW